MPFDAFISYSHAADGRLAPAVQRGLHRLARPWHRRRALWIFRDQTGLSVTPGLWSSIQTALDDSQYFVLLASPEAAGSPWVNKEIEHWVATKSPQRILPVLTSGEWSWDAATGDFTDDSTAVPAALRGVFVEEPLYLDLRWARDDLHVSLRHARFRDAIAQLAAPMHGVSKDELESEDVRQLRRARRMWSGAVALVLVLALLASLTGVLAMRNAGWANASAVEAQRQQANAQVQEGQAQAAAAETLRQEQLASEQRELADQATADAARQQKNATRQKEDARRAKEDARRYEEDARRQKEDARRAKEDATRQQEDARRAEEDAKLQKESARRNQKDAQRQQKLADEAEARAGQQEQLARKYQAQAEEATKERQKQEKIAREQEELAREANEEARRQHELAALQLRMAINQRLVDRARKMIEQDPRKGLMLGVAAEQLHADAQTKDQLSRLVMATQYAGVLADVNDVASLPDGSLVTADAGGTVSRWDVSRPAQPRRIGAVPTEGSAAKTLARSPDGKTIAVLDGSSSAVLWNLTDPAHPARLAELTDATGIVTLTLSPDGRTVATANRDRATTLWDVTPGQAPAALATMPAAHSLTFSPDGLTAVTSGAKATVWNLTDRALPVQLATLKDAKVDGHVLYSPKLHVVAVEEDGDYLVGWDLRNPALPKRGFSTDAATGDAALSRMEFSADGVVLALGDSSGATRLKNLLIGGISGQVTLDSQAATLKGRDGPVQGIALSWDGRTLITSGERRAATLWTVRGAFAQEVVAVLTRPSPADVVGLSYGPDGRSLIAADAPGTAVTWDLNDPAHPTERAPQTLPSGRIQLMELSKDGRTMAVGGMDHVVTLVDMTRPGGPELLARIDEAGDDVGTMALSPDGRTLAVGRYDGTTTLFDLTERTRPVPVARLKDRGGVYSVAFSKDGLTLAVAAGYNVSLYNVTTPSAPGRLAEIGLGDVTFSVSFSPDKRTMAVAAGWGGSATLWDIADLAQPHRLANLEPEDGMVDWVGFSPDGNTLVTAGSSEAFLWEISDRSTPLRFANLAHPQLRTRDLMFSPDGHTLASGGSRSVTLWDYSVPKDLSADPVKHACAITGRGLTAEEWALYVPELPYRATC